jgi:hypothetical protein
MKMSHVAAAFDAISAQSGRLEKTATLAALFKQATPHEAEIIYNLSLCHINGYNIV